MTIAPLMSSRFTGLACTGAFAPADGPWAGRALTVSEQAATAIVVRTKSGSDSVMARSP
jgi:hypothetical protein